MLEDPEGEIPCVDPRDNILRKDFLIHCWSEVNEN